MLSSVRNTYRRTLSGVANGNSCLPSTCMLTFLVEVFSSLVMFTVASAGVCLAILYAAKTFSAEASRIGVSNLNISGNVLRKSLRSTSIAGAKVR